MENFKKIKPLLDLLFDRKILKEIQRMRNFNDDVKFIHYFARINCQKKHTDGFVSKRLHAVSGISFDSAESAVLKCLMEAVERFSLFSYKDSNILWRTYSQLILRGQEALNPSLFKKKAENKKIGWVSGENLTTKKPCFIPAQLIYLSYKNKKDDVVLDFPSISTGAAAGFDHTSTLLRAIYEVVERDSFMNIYLNRIPAPKIKLSNNKDFTIKQILNNCERYKLELNVFETTTDLRIPTFVSILIDRTGIGPAVTIGAKADLNTNKAILGSILEPFITRTWLRKELGKRIKEKPAAGDPTRPFLTRGLFWSHPSMIDKLSFLLDQTAVPVKHQISVVRENELSKVMILLAKKDYDVFYTDITASVFNDLSCFVYKVIIPGLQPLYVREEEKLISLQKKRLKIVARFFNKTSQVNPLPHPFL